MPCNAVWSHKTLTLVFQGHVSGDEVWRVEASIHGDARFDDVRYQLYDATGVTSTDFTPDRAVENAYMDSVLNRFNQRHRTAFVGTEPAILSAIKTYIGILDEIDPGIERRLFARRDEAIAWLYASNPADRPDNLQAGMRSVGDCG